MGKAVLISIKPKWCALIASGRKTIEVRKTRPKITEPFKCYIYCTKGKNSSENLTPCNDISDVRNGKVIGEFVCDKIDKIRVFENGTVQFWMLNNLHNSCIEYDELADYIGWGKHGYGWHISGLQIYEQPKELSDFKRYAGFLESDTIKRPFQSWGYVEEIE